MITAFKSIFGFDKKWHTGARLLHDPDENKMYLSHRPQTQTVESSTLNM